MPLIPPEHLVSLNLGKWQPIHSTQDEISVQTVSELLKTYLLSAKNLETLTHLVKYADPNSRPDCSSEIIPFPPFTPSQRMPAFKHLNIAAYQWNHSASEVRSSWDFTQLLTLDIRGVPLSAFFRSIDFSPFRKLRSLQVGDLGSSVEEEQRLDGTLMLLEFLEWVPGLDTLSIEGSSAGFRFDMLSKMSSLRFLTLRNRINFEEDDEEGWVLGVRKLRMLRDWCPWLEELNIEMDTQACRVSLPPSFKIPFNLFCQFISYLEVLSRFSHLRAVTLYTTLKSWDKKAPRKVNASYTMFHDASNNTLAHMGPKITIQVGSWQVAPTRLQMQQPREGNKIWVSERIFLFPRTASQV